MNRIPRILLFGLCFLSSLTGVFAQEVLLGTTGGAGTGTLYSIDPSTGAATGIGLLVDGTGHPYAVTGLAFDNVTGILYGSTSNRSPTASNSLVAINPSTGAVTFIGSFATSSTMADLTFDVTTTTLYGTGSADGNLYSINPATGVATAIGSAGFPATSIAGAGVAANSAGQIFGAPEGASGPLVQYNKTNGSATTVATLSGAPFSSGSIGAMAFNSGGTLYGVNIDNNTGTRPTDLVTIDSVTGAVTNVGASVNFLDAIVFMTPVPEPTTTMLFGAGVVFLAITTVRRCRS
jgi:PEP-CTERM motif